MDSKNKINESCKKIKFGHTNLSYKCDNVFVQKKNNLFSNHSTKNNVLKQFDFVPDLIDDNEKESKWNWIDGDHLKNPTNEDLIKLASILKELHNSKVELASFNIKNRINEYRKIFNSKKIKIEIIEKLYKKINLILRNMDKNTPVHSDLWHENIIKTPSNNLYLVDWEYSHMGDLHFDLAYLIESYGLSSEQEKVFLDAYDDYDERILQKHKILVHYLTILWLYSNEEMYFSDQDSIKKLEILFENDKNL